MRMMVQKIQNRHTLCGGPQVFGFQGLNPVMVHKDERRATPNMESMARPSALDIWTIATVFRTPAKGELYA